MEDIEAQAIITAAEAQRNAALTQALHLAGKLALAEQRIRELESQVPMEPVPTS